jgi:hypothetical protein
MQIQQLNRTDAEKVFVVITNVDADTITTGMGVRYVGGAAAEVVSTNGANAVKIAADTAMPQFAGIAGQDIASNGAGLVQAFGYVDSILLSAEADKTVGVTGTANSFLKVGAVAGSFTSTQTAQALSTFAFKYVQAWTTTNISGGLNYAGGFVRAI